VIGHSSPQLDRASSPQPARELTATVPREYVHRAALAEVFPTDWERRGENRFAVRAQWPRSHPLFASRAEARYDPTVVAETVRQAGLLVCHAELGVPLDYRFLMHELGFKAEPGRLGVGCAPAMLEIDVSCVEVTRRAGRLSALRYETMLLREGELLGTGSASASVIAPAVYRRMRGHGVTALDRPVPLPDPAPPARVGRTSPEDVVLSPVGEPNRWLLRVDTLHPVLFDHPVDHAPGMTLVEAARQAALAAFDRPGTRITGMACSFPRYAELDAPCVIETCLLPRGTDGLECALVTGHQHERSVFSATVCVAPADER
jgi:hypothetical protein